MTSGFDQKDTVFIYLQKTVFSYESEDMKKTLEIRIEYFLFYYWIIIIGKGVLCVFYTRRHTTQGFIFLTMISIKFLKVVG